MPKKIINTDFSHIHSHIAWLALGITFVFCLFFVLATFIPVTKSALNDKISGWSWSPMLYSPTAGNGSYYSGYGLTSFNDCYCTYPSCPELCYSQMGGGAYGLTVDFVTKEITGWAWGGGVGWICFGDSCCSAGGGQNYCGDWDGATWEPINDKITVTYDDSQNPSPISGWAKIIASTSTVGWDGTGWLSLRGTTQDGLSEYGLRFSTTTLEIQGLAWNGFTDSGLGDAGMGSYHGYGWLCINEFTDWTGAEQPLCPQTSVFVNIPYVQTVDGNVYSQTNILPDLAAPSGFYNATYLILAGGNISNFTSQEKDKDPLFTDSYTQPTYPTSIGLPASSTNFFSALGYLDVPGISQIQTNKYGPQENFTGNWLIDGSYTNRAGYRVIINNGDLILGNSAPVIYEEGATTFIIDGDLHIERNVTYRQNTITDFADLPSVAYIVRGDVYIDPTVTEVAGNFIVLGADGVNCPNIGCGNINTGAGDLYTLTVNGIMMARQFNMQRAYASLLREPAEKVIYDGRLLVNPPPGLADFAKGLPVWSETPPN